MPLDIIEPPRIVETEQVPAAVIHMTVPRAEIHSAMEPAIREVIDVIRAQDIGPAGPMFTLHLTLSAQQYDFEVGFPISGPLEPTGRVKPGALPATRAAATVYEGAYPGLFDAWAAFSDWAQAEELPRDSYIWEVYVYGPAQDPDPATWRTELYLPLKN